MEQTVQSWGVTTAIQVPPHSGFQPTLVLSVGYVTWYKKYTLYMDITITIIIIIIHCHYYYRDPGPISCQLIYKT